MQENKTILNHIVSKAHRARRFTQLLILGSFIATFSFVRIITYLQKLEYLPNQSWSPHIHHLVPGIILLIFTGYIGISFWHIHLVRRLMAIFYGIGAALTLDEFALWVHLKDVYWEQEGRSSIDVVIIAFVLLALTYIVSEIFDKHKYDVMDE